jgi:putative DNA primase/helicase
MEKNQDDPRPVILTGPDRIAFAVAQAKSLLLSCKAPFFQRFGHLTRPITGIIKIFDGDKIRDYSTVVSVPVTAISLVPFLEHAAEWRRRRKSKETGTIVESKSEVPNIVCRIIIDERGIGFPPLSGFTASPYLTPSGRIVFDPGYDAETGLFMPPPNLEPFDVSDKPSPAERDHAIGVLLGLLDEFPFVSETDRSVALSILLTPALRAAMPVAPMHGTRAPHYANGKTYLLELAAAIAIGSELPVITFRERETEELEKTLTGLALSGTPIAAIDNVTDALHSPVLAQMIERPRLSLRPLGSSDVFEVNNQMTVLASGKNLQINADLVRRTLICNLDMKEVSPWRHTFARDPLIAIKADRTRYLKACLTIGKFGFMRELHHDCWTFASFGSWNRIVRSPMLWAGLPDPCACINEIASDDEDGDLLETIIKLWREHSGTAKMTGGRLANLAFSDKLNGGRELYEALMEAAGVGSDISIKRLSSWLKKNANTPTRSGKIIYAGRSHSNQKMWQVKEDEC